MTIAEVRTFKVTCDYPECDQSIMVTGYGDEFGARRKALQQGWACRQDEYPGGTVLKHTWHTECGQHGGEP